MKNQSPPTSKNESKAKPLRQRFWFRNLFGPVIVGLIVLAGQIFVDPRVAERVKVQESITQKRNEACEKAIELLQRSLASATFKGAKVPMGYSPPEKSPPTQLELNVAYNLLLIYCRSQTIAQEFFAATGPGNIEPNDIVKFLSAVRREVGANRKDSIVSIEYRLLPPGDDSEQMNDKAEDNQNPK
ncbi:MAG: hypothetical protein ABFE13_06100 [Phycisphaerales bacterium]